MQTTYTRIVFYKTSLHRKIESWREHGMSLILGGVYVCATGITSKEEKQIKAILNDLGGKYSNNFTGQVTHLLVKRVGSPKHDVFCYFIL